MGKTITICFTNNKGGSGKTTTCSNLGAAMAQAGKKVLLIDGDMQLNLSLAFFPENWVLEQAKGEKNLYCAIGKQEELSGYVVHTPYENLDLIPSSTLMSSIEYELFTKWQREFILRKCLQKIKESGMYDYILIDCMPSLGMLTINALSAADSVLIPVQPQYYAADGLMELLKVVKGIHQRFNPDLQIEGILFTMDNCRYNNAKRNKQAIKTTYGSDIRIFEQTIPRTESLAETASEGVSIFAYDGKSKGADSYLELVQEVLKHA